MAPFSLFGHRDRLQPLWTFTPGGLLWRLLPTTGGGFVGECRNPDQLRVTFFHLDATTGAVFWKDRQWAEPWWTGLEAVHGSVALLHEFVKPDMPEHARLHAVDLATGGLLWSAPELAFAAVRDERVLATRLDTAEREQVILDIRTGASLGVRSDEDGGDAWSLDGAAVHPVSASLQFPEAVATPEADPNGSSPEEVIDGAGWTVRGSYERLRSSGPPVLRQRLRVLDASGRTVHEQTIHSEARAFVPDTFFVWNGILYYLKEQRSLVAVRLPAVEARS